ncbi:MAG: DUF4398 domain-containing protein [Rhodospirillaceae bacterium]|nr:DUF4398 domain-containing protein [Rhodospirillaceae bacterium]
MITMPRRPARSAASLQRGSTRLMKVMSPVIALAATALVAGCASSPTAPREEVAAAELAVQQVQGTEAERYAPDDVRQAGNKLEAAKSAMLDEDYVKARRFAEQALIDAQVADVRADAARSGEVLAQSEESIEALEREALELAR